MAATLSSSFANAQETFSYDPSSPVGPANWGKLASSSCSGIAQSGMDVPTGACNEVNVDYMFKVRELLRSSLDVGCLQRRRVKGRFTCAERTKNPIATTAAASVVGGSQRHTASPPFRDHQLHFR
jgi:hypothetical protein